MTDTDWSFNLRSADSGFFDSDDDDDENVRNAGTYSCLPPSSSQTLQQIDLAAREDSALYKPNPWSIARINAASRSRQPNATLKPASKKPAAKKPPQGTIVDAFKRQAQKPITTNPSAQANRQHIPSQKPALTSAIDAPHNSLSAPPRSPTPIAHITTSALDPVPILSQPRIPQQRQGTLPQPSLPRKTSPTSHSSPSTRRSQNPHFVISSKYGQPFSSPAIPHPRPQHRVPTVFRPQPTSPHAPAYFGPHILEPRSFTPENAPIATDCVVTPTSPADHWNSSLTHPSHSKHHHTVAKREREAVSPHPHQRIQPIQPPPRPRISQPIIKASPKNEMIPPSPSFAKARRFFEYPASPGTTSERPRPEPPKEEAYSTPSPPRPRTSPPRKQINAYDLLPPSPDSEWSTLKPQTRAANSKGRSKAPDVKSGKFRLPLSMGNTTPKEPPQKKARVITYLPPPPPKKQQQPVVQPGLGAYDKCAAATLPQRRSVCFTLAPSLSSISKSEISDRRVALSATLGRNGSAELAYTCGAVRFKRRTYPLQTRSREDPSGAYA